jgi:hypothetical protein
VRARVSLLFVTLLVIPAVAVPVAAQAATAQGRDHGPVMHTPVAAPGAALHLADPTGPFSISGTVLDYDGAPVDDAVVEWGWYDPNAPVWFGPDAQYHHGGSADTGAGGGFSFTGVTSSPGNDDLGVSFMNYYLSTWTNDFSTKSTYVVQPGLVPVTIVNGPARATADVSVGDAATGLALTQMDLTGGSGLAAACAPGFDSVMVSFSDGIGAATAATEWTSPAHALVPASAGATVSQTITLDWNEAKRGHLAGPRCRHSVMPGDVVTFVLTHWPAGYQTSFWGTSWAEEGVLWYDVTALSPGAGVTSRVRLRIPSSASLEDVYEVGAYRSDDPKSELFMYDYLQLCRFAATKTAIEQGQAIRLRGLAKGSSPVVLFKRTKPAGQPGTFAAKGWTRVGSLTRSGGRFASGWMRPSRTTWYTVRYRGPAFTAFTPVVKVTVH